MRIFRYKYYGINAIVFPIVIGVMLSGCASYPSWLPSSGPSREQVVGVKASSTELPIQIVEVTDAVARQVFAAQKRGGFSEAFLGNSPVGYTVGKGDVIEVSVWEAPPAALFGSAMLEPRGGASTARVTTFPEQMVNSDGTINVPFAGSVPVSGKSLQQVEADVVRRLTGKANQPQVLLRVIRNVSSNVTVVGEVNSSSRIPLTARGERLLDALAAAGGVRQAVDKMTIQITRGSQVQAMPLDSVIRDPKQNIPLQAGDVVTALFQPLSFIVLGASGKNAEINFEAKGITLAQALARAGGLDDFRADARAVFVFRLEDNAALHWVDRQKTTPAGKVPVIYQVNLKDPASFFVAQGFPVENGDVLYISNAPAAELQKFMNILYSGIYSITAVRGVTR